MFTYRMSAVAVLMCCAAASQAAELVGVPGSGTRYPTPVTAQVAGKDVSLVLTGVAMRKKYLLNVYAIGSYLQDSVAARTAEELVAADAPKRLHLVMERDVDGKTMAEAFRTAIRANYPAPALDSEVNQLVAFMEPLAANKGDQVFLTHVPGVGLHCQMLGKAEVTIASPALARAVWEIYLGKNHLGEDIKKGLVSRR